ncbi:MAG: insulinase family protein, partial [Actinobacteria bacterium]|nr:insulinase family protein [Actinomycetota bacterium]
RPEDVRQFWHRYAAPTGSTLVIVGDLSGVAVEQLLSQSLGQWSGSAGSRDAPFVAQPRRQGAVVRVVDFPGAVQTHLLVGRACPPVPVDDRAGLRVATHYLGGFMSSRLSSRLREQKAVTYGVSAVVEHRGAAAVFRVESAVQGDATVESVADILDELGDLAAGRIDAPVYEAAVDNLYRVAPIQFKSVPAIASALVRAVLEALPDDYFDKVRAAMRDATPAESIAAFSRHVDLQRLTVTAVGDAAQIREGLRGLDRIGLDVEAFEEDA